MATDVRMRGTDGDWHSFFAGAVPDSVRITDGAAFKSIVGLAEPPSETKFIRNLANNAWTPLDTIAVFGPIIESYQLTMAETTSISLVAPTGIQVGDLLVVFGFDAQANTSSVLSMSGFDKRYESNNGGATGELAIFTKTAASGDIGATKTLTSTGAGSGAVMGGHYLRISGARVDAPFQPFGTFVLEAGAPLELPGIASGVDNALAMAFVIHDANRAPYAIAPASWDIFSQAGFTGPRSAASLALAKMEMPIAGNTGTASYTYAAGSGSALGVQAVIRKVL